VALDIVAHAQSCSLPLSLAPLAIWHHAIKDRKLRSRRQTIIVTAMSANEQPSHD